MAIRRAHVEELAWPRSGSSLTLRSMEPEWIESERIERSATFTANASPGEIFPLMCPVLEYRWVPEWSCVMAYSDSGVAEKDAVFHTAMHRMPHLPTMVGSKVVWTTITYQPDHLIEYLLVIGTDVVIRLSILLKDTGGATSGITWTMVITATSEPGRVFARRQYSEEKFRDLIARREQELNHYLRTGTMIEA